MEYWIVELRLEINLLEERQHDYCLRELDRAWPKDRARNWRTLLVALPAGSSEQAFRLAVEQEIQSNLKVHSPYPSKTDWTLAETFLASGWRKLPNGLHDFGLDICYTKPTGPDLLTWTIPLEAGTSAYATVQLWGTFQKIGIVIPHQPIPESTS